MAASEPGTLVGGRFRLVAEVARSDGAVVFRAQDEEGGGTAAVEILADDAGDAAVERLARDAVLLAGTSDPSIPRYLAHGPRFLATAWVEGKTVREIVALARSLATLRDANNETITAPEGDPTFSPPAVKLQTRSRTYVVDREIGRGGMGRILAAHDHRLGRLVAIKQLLRHRSASRFAREAALTARLEHPGIVPVYDSGTESGEPFYVMKLVSGRSLGEAIAQAGSAAERLALLPNALAAAEAMAYAHANGIIHRDLKPSNVIVGDFGETVVVDWGLAKDLRATDEAADETPPSPSEAGASPRDETTVGHVLGTPAYMAPEQAEGRRADSRSDVYALGGILYKLLSGRPPHAQLAAGMTRSADDRIADLAAPLVPLDADPGGLPADLVAIVHKAMALDPGARYPDAGGLAEDLKRFTTGQLVGAYRYGRWHLLRRWIARNRAAFVTATVALLVIATGATLSLQRILRASAVNEGLLRDSYFEQGRLRALEGDKLGAIAPLAAAYRLGATGAATRLLLEESARTTRPRLFSLTAHTGKLWSVAYSPDGRWIATGGADHTARIWDAETGALRATVTHEALVLSVAFSSDSRYLASAGLDPEIHVWDLAAGREIASLPTGARVWRLAFSPREPLLVAGLQHAGAMVWRIPDGTLVGKVGGDGGLVDARFCGDGTCFVTSDRSDVALWDAATLAPRARYTEREQIHGAAVSRTGALIAIGLMTGGLVLLGGDGTPIATRDAAHDGLIYDLDVSPDGTSIATGGGDGTVRLWSALGEPRGVLTGHRGDVIHVRFTPDGDRIVSTSGDGTARVWGRSGALLGVLNGHTRLVIEGAIRADGRRLVTASWDHTAKVWDLERAQVLRPVTVARSASLPNTAFAPGNDRLAVGQADGVLSISDVDTGAVACTGSSANGISTSASGIPKKIAWIRGDEIATIRGDGRAVELWDARRCAVEHTLEHPDPIVAMSSRRGPRLVTAAGGVVRVWNGDRLEASFRGYSGTIMVVGYDGDDVYATTYLPSAVVIDRIGDPGRRRILPMGLRPLRDVWFDREQGRIVVSSEDQFAYIWDLASGTLLRKIEGDGALYAIRPSRDGRVMIGVGGLAPTVWDRATGAERGRLAGHADMVFEGEFLDDQLFMSLGNNGTAIVSELEAGRPLLTFNGVEELVVADDRRSVALVGPAGVRLWSPRAPFLREIELRELGAP